MCTLENALEKSRHCKSLLLRSMAKLGMRNRTRFNHVGLSASRMYEVACHWMILLVF